MKTATICILGALLLSLASVQAQFDPTCTMAEMRNCIRRVMETGQGRPAPCAEGENPVRERLAEDVCCMSCAPFGNCMQLSRCAAGVWPQIGEDGCPSCVLDGESFNEVCPPEDLEACRATASQLPSCGNTTRQRDWDTCCFNCRMELPPCTENQTNACLASYDSLPECSLNSTERTWNRATCCSDCKRPFPPNGEGPVNGQCSADATATCLLEVPYCDLNEFPQHDPENFCCPSCKRRERMCAIEDVATCRTNRPLCAEGEEPTYVDGECCPTCRTSGPVCTASCGSGEICLGSECFPSECLEITLASDGTPHALMDLETEDLEELLLELVSRYCEHSQNVEQCNADFETLLESLTIVEASSTILGGARVSMIACEATTSTPTSRRLLSSHDSLLEAAVSDEEATTGYTVTVSEAENPNNEATKLVVFMPAFTLVGLTVASFWM